MYKVSLVLLLALSVTVMAERLQKTYYDLSKAQEYFDGFVKTHDRKYEDDADRQLHYEAFVKNLGEINKLNEVQDSAVFGITQFADYTEEERQRMHGVPIPQRQ